MRYRFGGLIFGGAYTWMGLFSEFYGILIICRYVNKTTILLFCLQELYISAIKLSRRNTRERIVA